MTRRRKQKNWLEWAVFAVGLMLVLPLLGYLAYDAWRRPQGRPIVHARLGEAVSHGDHYGIPVTVTNTGAMTAEGVLVEVTLEPANGEPETAEFEIQFVPSHAERKGWVTFRANPRSAKRLEARVRGFREP